MLIDAPSYDYDSDDDKGEIVLNQENSDQVRNYINSLM